MFDGDVSKYFNDNNVTQEKWKRKKKNKINHYEIMWHLRTIIEIRLFFSSNARYFIFKNHN